MCRRGNLDLRISLLLFARGRTFDPLTHEWPESSTEASVGGLDYLAEGSLPLELLADSLAKCHAASTIFRTPLAFFDSGRGETRSADCFLLPRDRGERKAVEIVI